MPFETGSVPVATPDMKREKKHGSAIDLNLVALGSLPKEVLSQLQAINADAFDKLRELQTPLVKAEMQTAYLIGFAGCAVAYLVAWLVMKTLVPKYKKIEDLWKRARNYLSPK